METLRETRFTKRYDIVSEEKAGGAVYTPKGLADFVSQQIAAAIEDLTNRTFPSNPRPRNRPWRTSRQPCRAPLSPAEDQDRSLWLRDRSKSPRYCPGPARTTIPR